MKRCLGCNEPSEDLYGKLCPKCRFQKMRRKRRNDYLQKKHGITIEEFEERTPVCPICKNDERVVLFKAGICRRCMSGVAMLPSVEVLKRAIEYLTRTKKRRHLGRTK